MTLLPFPDAAPTSGASAADEAAPPATPRGGAAATYIITVTGTRWAAPTNLDHVAAIGRGLLYAASALHHRTPHQRIKLRHGAAKGVDTIAVNLATGWGWTPDPYPADWPNCGPDCPPNPKHRRNKGGWTYCPLAGPRRNRVMLDASPRPDVVVGFPDISMPITKSGTWDCLLYAIKAGLFVGGVQALTVGDNVWWYRGWCAVCTVCRCSVAIDAGSQPAAFEAALTHWRDRHETDPAC